MHPFTFVTACFDEFVALFELASVTFSGANFPNRTSVDFFFLSAMTILIVQNIRTHIGTIAVNTRSHHFM